MSGQMFPNAVARMFDTPLMICPEKAAVIVNAYGPRLMGVESSVPVVMAGLNDIAPDAVHWQPRPLVSFLGDEINRYLRGSPDHRAYSIVEGVAVIPVTGTLVRRGAYLGESSGMTSYEGLSAQLRLAATDARVRAVALEIDSFGGEAAGIFDLAAQVRELRAAKPVRAFLSDYALSAGYAIAAQADHIVIPPFGMAGSIGVVLMHVDYSGKLEKDGIRVNLIQSGKHKTDGSPYAPLADDVRGAMQKKNDEMWAAFAQLVEDGRAGRMSVAQALRTEAAVYTGQEAVTARLADEVAEARAAFTAFLADMSAPSTGAQPNPAAGHVPAAVTSSTGCADRAAAHSHQETTMLEDDKTPGAAPAAAPIAPAAIADPVATERDRAAQITSRVALAGLPASLSQTLIASGATLETAFGKILDAKAAAAQDGGDILNVAPAARVREDGVDRTIAGLTEALLARCGMEGGKQNEFTGMSLREMARETLRARNLTAPAGGVHALASAAFSPSLAGGMHTGSDFGNVVANIANKAMMKGFLEAEETFEMFTSTGVLTDFKATRRVGLDAFPSLDLVNDGAEFQYGTMGDYAEQVMLATYGKMFAITRQTIINDDLDAFSKVPMKMGRAARRTVGNLVFAVLNSNPLMGDGVALFAAGHNNLAGAGALPSEVTINAAITAMAIQKDRSANAVALNIGPKYLLAPPSLRSVVLQALNSEYAPDDTAKAGAVKQPYAFNTVRNAATPIFDARLTAAPAAWYMLADAGAFDTIEVSYLDGVSTPFMEQQLGWNVDGTEFKVRIDAVAKALAWEGVYRNPGI
jgi:signal peptide peptidase SppA